MEKYKVAFIGAGMIANSAHLPAIGELAVRMEVVGVQDVRREAAGFMAAKLGVPAFENADEMFERVKPDLAVVTTPNLSHEPLCRLALSRGIHTVCEKPVVLSYREAAGLYETARQSGSHFFAAQTMRFTQDLSSLYEISKMGVLGDIYYCDAEFFRRRGIPKWGMFHMKDQNGGGCFADIGVHMMDALVHLTGAPKLLSVSGCASSRLGASDEQVYLSMEEAGAFAGGVFVPREYHKGEFSVEEFATGLARFDNGLNIQFRVSWAINLPSSEAMQLRIAGTEGGYVLPGHHIYTKLGNYRADIHPTVVDNTRNQKGWGHWEMYRHILDVLDGRCEYMVTEREVLTTALILECFYESARLGREVLARDIAPDYE